MTQWTDRALGQFGAILGGEREGEALGHPVMLVM
jgi:hypothetical protein